VVVIQATSEQNQALVLEAFDTLSDERGLRCDRALLVA
jgi:hypothetical protein